jgi:hypothetical protein
MKEIGKAETISDYTSQISYLEDILSTLEDLQTLYGKDKTFHDDYKDASNQMCWVEELQQELINEQDELVQAEVKKNEREKIAMNYEFERSRL